MKTHKGLGLEIGLHKTFFSSKGLLNFPSRQCWKPQSLNYKSDEHSEVRTKETAKEKRDQTMSTEGIIHRRISTNGIWMHVAELGKGPLVLLIHGFPELWSSWNYQITHLAKHGYRVVAPDMRGYGESDSPPDPASYTILHLVGDLIGLLDQLGEEKVLHLLSWKSLFYHLLEAQVAW